MADLLGSIHLGDEVVLKDVIVHIREFVDGHSGLRDWQGYFTLSIGVRIEPGGPYRLILADGRAGDVIIRRVRVGMESTTVEFVGTGPLAPMAG